MPPRVSRKRRVAASDPASKPDDAPWYKDAVIYEARVRAFYDHNGDGIGDFRGLAERLDYLEDLGVTAIWLLPFYPSPCRDDGYDISDYTGVHPECGTLEDFRYFLREAHRRGLKVITELVINHTSDQHPWFQRARRSPPGSRFRDYYVWSDTPERYAETRIIFQDFEPSNWTWDPVAKAYYWHRFYAHQPDLNFDSPDVRQAMLKALDFWFGLGVDGLRLDAIPYLFEREGTNCENLPETHAFLRELRAHVDRKYRNRMLLAEANQWPEDAAAYFGQGDECHMAFHFPVMPRLFMALQMEDRFPIIDILQQTPEIAPSCQWAMFLRNHDELTLEMVTDEERDYMYRVYAHDAQARINLGIRRRLAPLLGNDRRQVELMNALLFSLPGTPVIYYGDEIGMGDNFYLGDRNGVRTPMQWSPERNAGFSRANPQRLYLPVIIDPEYHYESVNVEAQNNSTSSLLRWMKRLIALRRHWEAFGRGSMTFLTPSNRKVLAFIRSYRDQDLLIVSNLAETVEYVELDLAGYKGRTPIELFSHNPFPPIGDLPYLLTLGPHSFYWFALRQEPARDARARVEADQLPRISVRGRWENLFRNEAREELERALAAFMLGRGWFADSGPRTWQTRLRDVLPLGPGAEAGWVALAEVQFEPDGTETCSIPLMLATGDRMERVRRDAPDAVIAEVHLTARNRRETGVLFDGLRDGRLAEALTAAIGRRRRLRGESGHLMGVPTPAFATLGGYQPGSLPLNLVHRGNSSGSVNLGDRFLLKFFRRLTRGPNPEVETGRFLTERAGFPHCAPVAGALEYRVSQQAPFTLGVLHGYVPNQGDAWHYTLDQVRHYFERALARPDASAVPLPPVTLLQLTEQDPPPLVGEMFGAYVETARLLGQRTAELHLALASDPEDPVFGPEPFTTLYQRSLYQSLRTLTLQTFLLLRDRRDAVPASAAPAARRVIELQDKVLQVFKGITGKRVGSTRIRIHGHYHLAQILHTGRDFVILGFEGETTRTGTERRIKRSPLRDVACMLRSFDWAVQTVLRGPGGLGVLRPADLAVLEPWAVFWRRWVCSAFLRAYRSGAGGASFVPAGAEDLERLLRIYLLEECIRELKSALDARPEQVEIPLQGILRRFIP